MKLKEQTFAVIADKQNSISHKWFNENSGKNALWNAIGHYYLYDGKRSQTALVSKPSCPIYTESEFEKLILQEEKERDFAANTGKQFVLIEGKENEKSRTI